MTETIDRERFFLSMPPGSVRAILSLQIVGLFWLLLLLPAGQAIPIPLHLYLLLGLVLVFFVSHGRSIAGVKESDPSPLGLPGGVIRFLLVAGTGGVLAYLHFGQGLTPEEIAGKLTPEADQVQHYWAYYFFAMIGGFGVGYLLRPVQGNTFFKALQAWLSVVAMLLMVVDIILQATVQTSISEKLDVGIWETILTAVVACYFGIRS